MLVALRRRLTYANVTASIALFIALGGTGYAALSLPRNSVKSQHIATGAVRSPDIRNSAVRGIDIRDDAVKGADVDEGSLGTIPHASTADRATAADTAARALEADALQGRAATAFMAGKVRVVLNTGPPVENNLPANVEVSCPAGERGIGGGGAWIIPDFGDGNTPSALNLPITASLPTPAGGGEGDMTGWQVHGRNLSGTQRLLRAYVVCVPRTP
jgi:hypothetical protein